MQELLFSHVHLVSFQNVKQYLFIVKFVVLRVVSRSLRVIYVDLFFVCRLSSYISFSWCRLDERLSTNLFLTSSYKDSVYNIN